MPNSKNKKNDRTISYFIFRASRMINGEKQYAKDYGLRAWKIPVYVKK